MNNLDIDLHLNEVTLSDCNGNLQNLYNDWNTLKKIASPLFSQSFGYSSTSINEISLSTHEISRSFSTVIKNSTQYFVSVGIEFKNTDLNASKTLESIKITH